MTRTDTSTLKRAVDLRKLVGETHPLIRNVRRCPFHDERTASFRVHEHYYYCFGCHAKGDAISWLQFLGLSFREAVAELEQRSGLSAASTVVRAPREAATLSIETAEWYNGITRFYQLFLESYPDNDHMRDLYEAHRTSSPSEIVASYRRVRTPWLAEQLRASAKERDDLAQFFRSAIQ